MFIQFRALCQQCLYVDWVLFRLCTAQRLRSVGMSARACLFHCDARYWLSGFGRGIPHFMAPQCLVAQHAFGHRIAAVWMWRPYFLSSPDHRRPTPPRAAPLPPPGCPAPWQDSAYRPAGLSRRRFRQIKSSAREMNCKAIQHKYRGNLRLRSFTSQRNAKKRVRC